MLVEIRQRILPSPESEKREVKMGSSPQVTQRKPKPHSNLRKRVKARQNRAQLNPNKSAGNRGPGHPTGTTQAPAVQKKMIQLWMEGKSVSAIAKEMEKDRATVTRIVKAEDMLKDAAELRREMYEKIAENIVARVDHEIGDIMSKDGAWMAVELGEQLGILPGKIHKQAVLTGNVQNFETPVTDKEAAEEQRVLMLSQRLAKAAIERGKLFGMKMPELDAIDVELEKVPARKEK